MNARQAWWLQLTLVVLVLVGLVVAWEAYQGIGSFTPQAEADDRKKKDDNNKFDHLACYEVYDENDSVSGEVRLYNQFEDKKTGVVVGVGPLRLLCVPTKKVHIKPTETVTTTVTPSVSPTPRPSVSPTPTPPK